MFLSSTEFPVFTFFSDLVSEYQQYQEATVDDDDEEEEDELRSEEAEDY